MTEQIETGSKKVRGMARKSLDLIEAMYVAARDAQPITGRGIGYKLFAAGLIPSMAKSEMQRVYRLLKEAREREIIPWDWIVETILPSLPAALYGSTGATTGVSSRFFWKSGLRKAPCEAYCSPCSINMASASA
jgi:hypothetical protein